MLEAGTLSSCWLYCATSPGVPRKMLRVSAWQYRSIQGMPMTGFMLELALHYMHRRVQGWHSQK